MIQPHSATSVDQTRSTDDCLPTGRSTTIFWVISKNKSRSVSDGDLAIKHQIHFAAMTFSKNETGHRISSWIT